VWSPCLRAICVSADACPLAGPKLPGIVSGGASPMGGAVGVAVARRSRSRFGRPKPGHVYRSSEFRHVHSRCQPASIAALQLRLPAAWPHGIQTMPVYSTRSSSVQAVAMRCASMGWMLPNPRVRLRRNRPQCAGWAGPALLDQLPFSTQPISGVKSALCHSSWCGAF
jgi:hypothetical protein